MRVLLLNASGEPHSVVSAEDAVCMILEDEVDEVELSNVVYHSQRLDIRIPTVMRLRKYVVMPAAHRSVLLRTKTVLARDGHVCGYCGKKGLTAGVDGTVDHIVPRALGGKHTWENVVAACYRCNHRKGDKTLAELGWVLLHTPRRPVGVTERLKLLRPPPEWLPYLQVA